LGLGLSLAVIILAYKIFYVVPWAMIPGTFNVQDVGLVLLLLGIVIAIFRSKDLSVIRNSFTLLVAAFLVLLGVQVTLASFNYNQSLINGIIAARYQAYYLVFFLYLIVLTDEQRLRWMLDGLSMLAIVVVIFAALHYFGINVYYSERADTWNAVRAGIERAYAPGFPVVNMALVWQLARYLGQDRSSRWVVPLILIFATLHLVVQSRGPIISISVAYFVMLLLVRNFKLIATSLVIVGVAAGIVTMVSEENFITHPFVSAAQDLDQGSGTWGARMNQIEVDVRAFSQHPWIGSGLIALRTSRVQGSSTNIDAASALAANQDLGYTHWLKFYGLVGILWLIAFLVVLWTTIRRIARVRRGYGDPLVLFIAGYGIFLAVSMITLPQLVVPERIVLTFLLPAILVRLWCHSHTARSSAPGDDKTVPLDASMRP